ncbi:MAG: thioesterase family protein [Myxococcota bacterium]|nr:thioesterase family protein [Myxococcota bacterium]
MPDLIRDTRAEPGREPGLFHTTLSRDWEVWGPNGGYLAALALRAGCETSRLGRPASFQCHFLSVGAFEPATIRVRSVGGGKRAESLQIEIAQADRTLLTASLWMVAEGIDGYAHDVAERPEVPGPEGLPSYAERAGDEYAQWYSIWRSIEGRPLSWREPPGHPEWFTWLRLTDSEIGGDVDDAIRQLFWLDMPGWNATIAAHAWPFPYLTPNLDLTVQFHRFAPEIDWQLADGLVPVATEGLVGCSSRLWAPDGRLLATATSKHVCRRNPGYEEELERARAEGLIPAADAD